MSRQDVADVVHPCYAAVDSFPEEAKAGRVAYVNALRESLGQ